MQADVPACRQVRAATARGFLREPSSYRIATRLPLWRERLPLSSWPVGQIRCVVGHRNMQQWLPSSRQFSDALPSSMTTQDEHDTDGADAEITVADASEAEGWHRSATKLAKAGELEAATELYHKALTARVKLFGADHEATERTRMTLAAVYETLLHQARYPVSDEIEKQIRAVLGEGHPPEPEYAVGGSMGHHRAESAEAMEDLLAQTADDVRKKQRC